MQAGLNRTLVRQVSVCCLSELRSHLELIRRMTWRLHLLNLQVELAYDALQGIIDGRNRAVGMPAFRKERTIGGQV